MIDEDDDAPPWWRAASLAERAAVTGADATEASPERIERFESNFPDEEVLAERLAMAGVDPARLTAVLGAGGPPPRASAPEWWRNLVAAYDGDPGPPRPGDSGDDAKLLHGARLLTAPLRQAAGREIADRARSLVAGREGDPFQPGEAARILAATVGMELAAMAAPAVALDLQAARIAGDLEGDDGAERAAGFMRGLAEPERARELLGENPALARMLHRRMRLGVDAGLELLAHLAADWHDLRGGLLGDDPGPLSGVAILGDAHAGGWRVLRLDFGRGARVVHKPRSLTPERAYSRLLDWLGRAGFGIDLRAPATVIRDGYGWQEWVEAEPCDSRDAVRRSFVRLGGQLALLHALHAVDLHHENVIACGEHPMLVDLEGLLHPRLGAERAADVDPLIAETSLDCVLRVGLLPRADVAFDVDVSGIGGDPAARIEVEGEAWVGSGADDARLGRSSVLMRPGANVPRLGDEPVAAHEYADEVAEGFASAYRLLTERREELAAPAGPLAEFADVETRVILRATRAYGRILARQLSHPPALADGVAREEVVDVVWRAARRRPDLRRAAAAEHHDLRHGDVPRVTARPGSPDGFHHALGTIDGMLGPWPAPRAVDSVGRLSERDLERQLAFVRAALLGTAARAPAARPATYASAADVVARLDVLALREGDRAGWLTAVAPPRHSGRVLRLAGTDLTTGHAGIALFLARYAAATGEGAELAAAGTRQLIAMLDRDPDPPPAATGWALIEIGSCLGDSALAERGRAVDGAGEFDPADAGLQPWGADPLELPGLSAGLAGLGLELLAEPARGTTSRNSSASVGRTSLK